MLGVHSSQSSGSVAVVAAYTVHCMVFFPNRITTFCLLYPALDRQRSSSCYCCCWWIVSSVSNHCISENAASAADLSCLHVISCLYDSCGRISLLPSVHVIYSLCLGLSQEFISIDLMRSLCKVLDIFQSMARRHDLNSRSQTVKLHIFEWCQVLKANRVSDESQKCCFCYIVYSWIYTVVITFSSISQCAVYYNGIKICSLPMH